MKTHPRPLRWYVLFGLLAFTSALSACSDGGNGVPDAQQDRLKALPERIEAARVDIKKNKTAHGKLLNQQSYRFIKGYTPAEQHVDRFAQANKKLKQAETAYQSAEKIADEYADEKLNSLTKALGTADKLISESDTLAKEPAQWAKKVLDTKSDPDAVVQAAEESVQAVTASHPALVQVADATSIEFPKQSKRIPELVAPLTELKDTMASAATSLQSERSKPEPNFAIMTEHSQTVLGGEDSFDKQDEALRAKFKELPTTETQTLLDIRVDTVVFISRTTWDESVDGGENNFDYPDIAVDQDTAEYFSQFEIDKMIAHAEDSDGDDTQGADGVDQAQWNKLGIVEEDKVQGWPGSHNHAEYYWGGLEDSYCHQVLVLVNGEPDSSGRPEPKNNYCSQYDTEGDLDEGIYWIEPDEEPLFNAMGMDIFAKGYGDFHDEAATEASPPGLVYVGDANTGEWQQDSNGNSFWAFYGRYRLFSDLIGGSNPYYYRNEYNAWNSGYRYQEKPYYAGTSKEPRFGGASPMVATRFPNSNFSKTGLSDATVRSAGPVARAGGPGGGGK